MRRPRLLAVLCLVILAFGLLSLGQKIYLVASPQAFALFKELFRELNEAAPVPLPLELHLAHAFASSLVYIVAGIFMWGGRNWARAMFLLWSLTALALTVLETGLSPVLGVKSLVYLLFLALLTLRSSNKFFRGRRGSAFVRSPRLR